MKKTLLIIAIASMATFAAKAQTYQLNFENLYQQITAGITAGTEVAAFNSGSVSKILLNQDRTVGIYTIISPSTRTARMDTCTVTFAGGYHIAKIRLETNGASNSTNGRKIFIACPAAGKLTVGAWTATAARGYTVESSTGTVLYSTASAMDVVASPTLNLPVQQYDIAAAGTIVLNPNNGIYYGFIQFDVTTGVSQILADKGITYNGSEISNKNGLDIEVYNIIGKRINSSKTAISTSDLAKGVYVVRVVGLNETLKFSK
jgi:hypothetical protein